MSVSLYTMDKQHKHNAQKLNTSHILIIRIFIHAELIAQIFTVQAPALHIKISKHSLVYYVHRPRAQIAQSKQYHNTV